MNVAVAPLKGAVPRSVAPSKKLTFVVGASGPPCGPTVAINGTGFGDSQNGGHVTLVSAGGTYTPLTVTSWSDTQISAKLPELTPIGLNYMYVNAHGLDCICTNPFLVTKP